MNSGDIVLSIIRGATRMLEVGYLTIDEKNALMDIDVLIWELVVAKEGERCG